MFPFPVSSLDHKRKPGQTNELAPMARAHITGQSYANQNGHYRGHKSYGEHVARGAEKSGLGLETVVLSVIQG
jgi:hypothetical protein